MGRRSERTKRALKFHRAGACHADCTLWRAPRCVIVRLQLPDRMNIGAAAGPQQEWGIRRATTDAQQWRRSGLAAAMEAGGAAQLGNDTTDGTEG